MQAFLTQAQVTAAAPAKRRRTRHKVKVRSECVLYGTFVAAARTARNIKFTIAPFATQPGLGAKSSTSDAYRDGDILFLSDGDEFAPVVNLAEEPFSATQFVRGEYDVDLKFGDVVKMGGVHAKRSGDKCYYNCSLVEKWAALPDWDVSTPCVEKLKVDMATNRVRDQCFNVCATSLLKWTLSDIKMTKFDKPYCRLDIDNGADVPYDEMDSDSDIPYSTNHKIMLWKEHIDRIIELTSGFVIPNYEEIDLKSLLAQCALVYWAHGMEGHLVKITMSENKPIGFDPVEMVNEVMASAAGAAGG